MSRSVEMECAVGAIDMLLDAIRDLNHVSDDLREAQKEMRMMKNCHGENVQIDFLVKCNNGEKIGVRKNNEGNMEFVTEKETKSSKETIDKIVQTYARLKILNEVKKKGYQQVKEEKLPDGSIRLVVEKWR